MFILTILTIALLSAMVKVSLTSGLETLPEGNYALWQLLAATWLLFFILSARADKITIGTSVPIVQAAIATCFQWEVFRISPPVQQAAIDSVRWGGGKKGTPYTTQLTLSPSTPPGSPPVGRWLLKEAANQISLTGEIVVDPPSRGWKEMQLYLLIGSLTEGLKESFRSTRFDARRASLNRRILANATILLGAAAPDENDDPYWIVLLAEPFITASNKQIAQHLRNLQKNMNSITMNSSSIPAIDDEFADFF
jgi:hypothetical protein